MSTTQVFFTSYARLDNTDGRLKAAIDEVVKRVVAKIGDDLPPFFDTTEIKNGLEWEKVLGKALQELRVIVCLCSPAYLKSAFCAKEFEVFRRRVDKDAQNAVAIIPVIWEPVALPEVMGRFHQPKDPRFPSDYYVAGLYQLSRLKSQEDNFVTAIEALANDIRKADQDSKLPPWPHSVKYDDRPNFLNNPKPERYGVSITVLSEKNSQWKPGNVRTSVGALVDTVAHTLSVAWEEIPAGPLGLSQQLEDAEKRRLASVLVVDRDAATKAPWSQTLEQICQAARTNVAVLVGCRKTDLAAPTDVKDALAKLIPGMISDYFMLDDEEGFKAALTKIITTLRIALVQQDEAAKVVAPDLRDAAVSRGIPVDAIATLTGPGSPS